MKKGWKKSLDKFIAGMIEKLEENKDKDGWKRNKDDWYLHTRLLEEVAEYFVSLNHPMWSDLSLIQEFVSAIGNVDNKKYSKKEQKRELADVGNIAMMLYDNTK